jgi:hypothetical protein
MKKSFEIESDCLDIIKRIKSIDKDYFVKYNQDGKFELHHRGQGRNTYCLTFPFDELDERAYLHTLKTRVQNSDEIFKEMERENLKLMEKQTKKILNDAKEKFYDS